MTTVRLAFFAWGDFHARLRFARSTIPEEKWGTTRGLISRLTCDNDRNCTLGNGASSYEQHRLPHPPLNQEEDQLPAKTGRWF